MEKGRLRQGMAGRVTVLVITEDWGSDALEEGGREGGRRREGLGGEGKMGGGRKRRIAWGEGGGGGERERRKNSVGERMMG